MTMAIVAPFEVVTLKWHGLSFSNPLKCEAWCSWNFALYHRVDREALSVV